MWYFFVLLVFSSSTFTEVSSQLTTIELSLRFSAYIPPWSEDSPCQHGGSSCSWSVGKAENPAVPIPFLAVFRNRKHKLVVANLRNNERTRLAPPNQRIFEFIRQMSGNNYRLRLVRAGLAGFRTSAITVRTCASTILAGMTGIFIGEMGHAGQHGQEHARIPCRQVPCQCIPTLLFRREGMKAHNRSIIRATPQTTGTCLRSRAADHQLRPQDSGQSDPAEQSKCG